MAEVIGAAIIAGVGAEAAVGTTVLIGTLTVNTVIGTATLLAGSIALQALLAPDQKQRVANQQFSSRQAIPPRQRAYGRVKVAGPKMVLDSAGGAHLNAIYHSEGPIDGIEEWWLGDKRAAIAANSLGGPAGVAPWLAAVSVESHLGSETQAASATLQRLAYWSQDHHAYGCAYSVVTSIAPEKRFFDRVFQGGRPPELRVVLRGVKVRDFTDTTQTADPATWKWNDRAGAVIYDFLTHPVWGMRVPYTLMHEPSWTTFTARCHEVVITKAGAPVPRYYLGGVYQLTDEPADVLRNMLETCDGDLYLEADGTIGIRGGAFPTPTVTLRDPTILSMTLERGNSKLAGFNRLKTSFSSPVHDYQPTEGDAWDNVAAQNEADDVLERDFPRPWVQEHNQLRRLAKIYDAKENPEYRITGMVTDMSGAPALFEESVRLILTRRGIDAVFLVRRAVANVEAGTCTFDLTSISPNAYVFDPATEEGRTPTIPGAQAAPSPPAPPQNLTVLIERRDVSGGINAVFGRLTATVPTRQDASLIGRYRRVGDVNWIDMAPEGDNRGSVISSVLADGEAYEFQGAIATFGRALQSDWTAAQNSPITATADIAPPAAIASASATGAAGKVTLQWTNPSSANFSATRVYFTSTSSFTSAQIMVTKDGAPGVTDTYVWQPPAGIYYFWFEARNASGVAASRLGPISGTVT